MQYAHKGSNIKRLVRIAQRENQKIGQGVAEFIVKSQDKDFKVAGAPDWLAAFEFVQDPMKGRSLVGLNGWSLDGIIGLAVPSHTEEDTRLNAT